MSYDRAKAVAYAHEWAYRRNPRYYDFSAIGGDCTNFVSQCLFAGCGVMNYARNTGWYYINVNNRSPAWTGVQFLYEFLTRTARTPGPRGEVIPESEALPGDIVQLSFYEENYAHSLFVVDRAADAGLLVATHTFDADYRPLSSYTYEKARVLRIFM